MLQRVMWPPNYFDVYERRRKAVVSWRKNPKILQAAHAAYAVNPADFISDLVDTFDPRNAAKGEMTRLPFVLFRRQRERRPARMTMRCTGLLGSVARPVHCLNSSTSRCSVSGRPSITLATTRHVQKVSDTNGLPSSSTSAIALVSVITGVMALPVACGWLLRQRVIDVPVCAFQIELRSATTTRPVPTRLFFSTTPGRLRAQCVNAELLAPLDYSPVISIICRKMEKWRLSPG